MPKSRPFSAVKTTELETEYKQRTKEYFVFLTDLHKELGFRKGTKLGRATRDKVRPQIERIQTAIEQGLEV